MQTKKTFIGLGGNVGDTAAILNGALQDICALKGIGKGCCSRFYRTSPVSPIPQADYINAVCSFETTLSPRELLEALQKIEGKWGKVPKPKDAPRPLDLDILLYGNETVREADLQIPHPCWEERLFVLIPLNELIDEVAVGDRVIPLKHLIEQHQTQETLEALSCEKYL